VEQLQRKRTLSPNYMLRYYLISKKKQNSNHESAELKFTLDEHIAQMMFLLTISKQNATPTVRTTELAVTADTSTFLSTTVSSTQPTQDTPPVIYLQLLIQPQVTHLQL